MNFQFYEPITANNILSKYTEEQIMSYYLRVPVSNKLVCSPLRKDKRPTCSFYRNNKGVLIFKDFSTGQHLDCWNVVMAIFGCDYHKALKIVANDFGICKSDNLPVNKGKIISPSIKVTEKEFSKIGITAQPFSEGELKWWKKYGITEDILKKFKIYSCKYVFLNDNLVAQSQQHSPIFGYYGGTYHKNELWKIYFPKRKEYRWMSNWPSKKLQGYEMLPKTGKLCVITKSLKDVAALAAYNIPACAPNSETIIPSEAIIENLCSRFKHVVALWDNDLTGVTFLNKIKKKYPKLHCFIIPRKLGAKDFSDLREKYGYKKTKQYIVDYLKWLKEKTTMI